MLQALVNVIRRIERLESQLRAAGKPGTTMQATVAHCCSCGEPLTSRMYLRNAWVCGSCKQPQPRVADVKA
jgi:ribosomal protein L37AE/L43A